MPPKKSSRMKIEFTHHGYAGQIDVAVGKTMVCCPQDSLP